MWNLIHRARALRDAVREVALLRPELAGVIAMTDEVKALVAQLHRARGDASPALLDKVQALDQRVRSLELRVREAARLIDRQPLFVEAVALRWLYRRLADRRSRAAMSTGVAARPSDRDGAGYRGIAIISAPKSASTFLWHLLERVAGSFEPRRILQTAAGRYALPEADLSCAAAIRAADHATIVREHLLPNANTLLFLERSRLWPVIVWRAVDDSLVSLAEEWTRQWSRSREEIEQDGYHPQFLGAVPQTFIDNFMRTDWRRRYNMTIDVALPWYCHFIAGWQAVRSRNPRFGSFLTYEEIAQNGVAPVAAILQALELGPRIDVGEAAAKLKADRAYANFNVGRSERGRELLTRKQKVRIDATLAAFMAPHAAAG